MSATATISSERGSLYAGLSRQIRAAELLGRARGHYLLRIAATVSFFAICWLVFLAAGDSWWTLVPAGLLGLVSTQVAFLGHDGGHQQIAASRVGNHDRRTGGGNLLIGLSFGWWADKHNRHHAHPNTEAHDPDIGAACSRSPAPMRQPPAACGGLITAYQAGAVLPAADSRGAEPARGQRRACSSVHAPPSCGAIEMLALLVHVTAYLGRLLLVLSPVTHWCSWRSIKGCSVCTWAARSPQPQGHADPAADEEVDYLRRQVLTSRNVRGGWLVDDYSAG